MAVYLDDARLPFGRMVMSHMTADTIWELHAMAAAIGVQRKWFQETSIEHYDISEGKRKAALKLGVIEERVWDNPGPEKKDAIDRHRAMRSAPRLFTHMPKYDMRLRARYEEAREITNGLDFLILPRGPAIDVVQGGEAEDFNAWIHGRDRAALRGQIRRELKGKDLRCDESTLTLHCDVIFRIANEEF